MTGAFSGVFLGKIHCNIFIAHWQENDKNNTVRGWTVGMVMNLIKCKQRIYINGQAIYCQSSWDYTKDDYDDVLLIYIYFQRRVVVGGRGEEQKQMIIESFSLVSNSKLVIDTCEGGGLESYTKQSHCSETEIGFRGNLLTSWICPPSPRFDDSWLKAVNAECILFLLLTAVSLLGEYFNKFNLELEYFELFFL